jgi:hypothetical protein
LNTDENEGGKAMKFMKVFFSIAIISTLLVSLVFAADKKVNITIDGNKVQINNLVKDGTTYVPLKDIVKLLGDNLEWDAATQTVKITTEEEKDQNINTDLKEKEELINKFTQKLKNTHNQKVLYGDFLDDDYYVYVVTDQIDEQKEKILIVALNDGTVERRFEGGDLDKEGEAIKQIHKLFVNRLNNWENPNVCVLRKNEKYTKVQIFEVNKKEEVIHHVSSCKRDNETGEYIGDKNYEYVVDFSFPYDYCDK